MIDIPLSFIIFFLLMIRRPPRSTLDRSSAASDVYKRQGVIRIMCKTTKNDLFFYCGNSKPINPGKKDSVGAVSYTHLRAHETVLDLVCRLLLEKKKMHKIEKCSRIHQRHNKKTI